MPPTLMQLARLRKPVGARGEAYAETLRETIAADPHVPQPYVLLARWQLRQGPLLAIGTLVAVRAEFPEYPPLLLTLGLAQGANGESADAIGTLRWLIELQPQSAEARYALVTAHTQAGDAASPRHARASLAVDNRRPEALPLLGTPGRSRRQRQRGRGLARSAAARSPGRQIVLDFIGQRRYRQYGALTALDPTPSCSAASLQPRCGCCARPSSAAATARPRRPRPCSNAGCRHTRMTCRRASRSP